jgi:glycosyltransferase involved in cell wall biosynthesis
MKILILYRELAGYTVECLNKLAVHHEILLVSYPINSEAPFQFEFHSNITATSKTAVSLKKIQQFNPSFILCSGWSDSEYIEWMKVLNKPTALAFDTAWQRNMKFILGSFYFKLKYKKIFRFAFIPGKAQYKTSGKLGFSAKNTLEGFYTCEDVFRIKQKSLSEKKELWCIARYIPAKNLDFLCEAFLSIQPNERSGWTLNIAGTGVLFPNRVLNQSILHHGFLQPKELSEKLENATAFVLPSIYEPWGVVVHEMASLGKPLLLSNAVGAQQDLLLEGKNGYSFNPHSKDDLKLKLLKIFNTPLDALQAMGNHSADIAQQFSSDIWVGQFTKMLNDSCAE